MSVDLNLGASVVTTQTPVTTTGTGASKETSEALSTEAAKSTAAASGFSSEAAVYEKSDAATSTDGGVYKKTSVDHDAIVSQLKADAAQRESQMLDMVRKVMTGQGQTLAKADDMWKFLAEGNFTVDAATKAQAQADIAEDGYWGVEKTSDRILEFAKALAGDDVSKADKLLAAFDKGFKQATSAWGKDLPDISQQTYDAVHKKFDDWKNQANQTATQTVDDNATTAAASAATTATEG